MRWRNTETPTFAGSGGTNASGPAVVETFDLVDRLGNVVATFIKDVAGAITLNVVGAISQSGVTLASAFVYKGSIDCSSNPNWPAASAGDVYKVSVAGKIGGASGQTVQVGDVLICNVAGITGTDAAVGANWMIEQGNIVSTADVPDSANKRYVTDAQSTVLGSTSGTNTGDQVLTSVIASSISDGDTTHAPDGNSVFDALALKQTAGADATGSATNDAAAAGKVGELLTASLSSASPTSLSTGTAKTLISLSLTAGDWDVWGVADYVPDTTTTTAVVAQGISTTDNTLGAQDTFTACSGGNLTGSVLGALIAENTPMRRISLASPTTVYLVGKASFAVSTLTAYGSIFARRRR